MYLPMRGLTLRLQVCWRKASVRRSPVCGVGFGTSDERCGAGRLSLSLCCVVPPTLVTVIAGTVDFGVVNSRRCGAGVGVVDCRGCGAVLSSLAPCIAVPTLVTVIAGEADPADNIFQPFGCTESKVSIQYCSLGAATASKLSSADQ